MLRIYNHGIEAMAPLPVAHKLDLFFFYSAAIHAFADSHSVLFLSTRPLHAADLLLVQVLVQTGVKVLPPLEEHRVADELEPGGELEAGVLEQLLQLVSSEILCRLDLVHVGVKVNVGLDEENVVDYANCQPM